MKTSYLPLFFLLLLPAWGFGQMPTKGIVANYPMNGDGQDVSGLNNHGILKGGVTPCADRFGTPCSALQFDGSSGYLTIPNSGSLNSIQGSFAVSVWVKLPPIGGNNDLQWLTICCKSNRALETNNIPHFRAQSTRYTVSINTDFTENQNVQLPSNQWVHFVLNYTGNAVETYVNGQKSFQFPYQGRLNPNNHPMDIGRDRPGIEEFFKGSMDDLRIFNRALNPNEVQMLAHETYPPRQLNLAIACPPDLTRTVAGPSPVIYPPPRGTADCISPTLSLIQGLNSGKVFPLGNTQVTWKAESGSLSTTCSFQVQLNTAKVPEKYSEAVTKGESKGNKKGDDEGNGDKNPQIKFPKELQVQSEKIRLYLYDHDEQDGDVVSLNFNGAWVLEKHTIKKKKHPLDKNKYIDLVLPGPGEYKLYSKAWNLGRKPPNTLTVELHDGVSPPRIFRLTSEIGIHTGFKIVLP